jgi:hypothetical protein
MFPEQIRSDATIFNCWTGPNGLEFQRTVILRENGGAFFHAGTGFGAARKGSEIEPKDKATLMISMDTKVVGRTYVSPEDFAKMDSVEKNAHWTMAKEDRFVTRVVMQDPDRLSELAALYGSGNVFTVSSADENFYGSPEKHHLKITGR